MVFYCYFKISYSAILFTSLAMMVQSSLSSSSIDERAFIGPNEKIGENVTIGAYSLVHDLAVIDSHTTIRENSTIGKRAHIKERCTIGKNVSVGDRVQVGFQTIIGDNSEVKKLTKIGENCTIASKVKIHVGVKIGNNNTIAEGSGIGSMCETADDIRIDEGALLDIGAVVHNEYIGKQAYIGGFSKIEANSTIGEKAVIHRFVRIKSGVNVKPTEIYARTPSSSSLYSQCFSFVLAHRNSPEFNPTSTHNATDEISPEFNQEIRELIDKDMESLNANCSQSIDYQGQPEHLPKIIGMYLAQYHGIERFHRYLVEFYDSPSLSSPSLEITKFMSLDSEKHVTDNANKTILEPDVAEKFVQLLVIGQDAKRKLRAHGDSFCGMINEIETKQRNIHLVDADD